MIDKVFSNDFIIELYNKGIIFGYDEKITVDTINNAVSSLRYKLKGEPPEEYNIFIHRNLGFDLLKDFKDSLGQMFSTEYRSPHNCYATVFIQGIKFYFKDLPVGSPIIVPEDYDTLKSLIFRKYDWDKIQYPITKSDSYDGGKPSDFLNDEVGQFIRPFKEDEETVLKRWETQGIIIATPKELEPEWIPVEEMMPENDDDVLARFIGWDDMEFYRVLSWEQGSEEWTDWKGEEYKKVTHWKQIKPPK